MEREEKFSYTEDTSRSLLSIKQGLSLRQFLEEGSHETRRFIKACYASSLFFYIPTRASSFALLKPDTVTWRNFEPEVWPAICSLLSLPRLRSSL